MQNNRLKKKSMERFEAISLDTVQETDSLFVSHRDSDGIVRHSTSVNRPTVVGKQLGSVALPERTGDT